MDKTVIYHVDVNSAFLSWTAAYRVSVLGESFDLRTVPSVVGGDQEKRHGIVLAKSLPAKKFGVKTGESIMGALSKCPGLTVVPPDYSLYVRASRRFIALLQQYAPTVEQYSIDEAFCDMTGTQAQLGDPVDFAQTLGAQIRERLGFTVNIGVSSNKLLAKMASDFEKPDRVHSLFPEEIPQKLWPLPVGELFFVGRATRQKLQTLGISTIGQLARADPALLRRALHKQGLLIWDYANGRCDDLLSAEPYLNKGYGNSTTTPYNITDAPTAHKVLLSLCETVGMRMRQDRQAGRVVTVHYRSDYVDKTCRSFSRQAQLASYTNVTEEIYRFAARLLDLLWDGRTPIRQLGVHMGQVAQDGCRQMNLFDGGKYDRMEALDHTVDGLRERFGEGAILRARFLDGQTAALGGGLHPERRTGITKPV